jgi:hypothetical protein
MPGETMPPEPVAEGNNDVPVQEPGPASPAEPSQLVIPAPGAAPTGTGQPAGFPDPEAPALPGPPGTPLDPAAVTGPPWPRLVAAAVPIPRPGWPAGQSSWGSCCSRAGSQRWSQCPPPCPRQAQGTR